MAGNRGRRRTAASIDDDRVATFERRARKALERMTREEAATAVARAQAELDIQRVALADLDRERAAHLAVVDAHRQTQARLGAIRAELDQERAAHRDTQTRLDRAIEDLSQERLASQARLSSALEELDQERAAHCLTQARFDAIETQRDAAQATATALARELDRLREARRSPPPPPPPPIPPARIGPLVVGEPDKPGTAAAVARSRMEAATPAELVDRILPAWRASLAPEFTPETLDDFIQRNRATLESVAASVFSSRTKAKGRGVRPHPVDQADWTSIPEEVEPWAFQLRTCGRLARAGIGREEALQVPLEWLIDKIGNAATTDVLYWRRVVAGDMPTPLSRRPFAVGYPEKQALVGRLGGIATEHLAGICARTGVDPRIIGARLTKPLVHLRFIKRRSQTELGPLLGFILNPGETTLFNVAAFALATEQDRLLVDILARRRLR